MLNLLLKQRLLLKRKNNLSNFIKIKNCYYVLQEYKYNAPFVIDDDALLLNV